MNIDTFNGLFDDFDDWLQDIVVYKTQTTTVDFEPVTVAIESQIEAIVQTTNPSSLNIDTIDHTLKYITVHSKTPLSANDYVVYKGVNFRVLQVGDWSDYTFNKYLCEEYKKPIEGV
jgi:hypothetical protein